MTSVLSASCRVPGAVPRAACLVLAFALHAGVASAQVAVRGETVYTMAGAPIKDGVVVIRDGKIAQWRDYSDNAGVAAELARVGFVV